MVSVESDMWWKLVFHVDLKYAFIRKVVDAFTFRKIFVGGKIKKGRSLQWISERHEC